MKKKNANSKTQAGQNITLKLTGNNDNHIKLIVIPNRKRKNILPNRVAAKKDKAIESITNKHTRKINERKH